MPKERSRKPRYVVANPRGLPEGRHVLRVGNKRWFEGDSYDGPVSAWLISGGFLVEVDDGEG